MNYPTPEENPMCQCKGNPMKAFWCMTGHMTECHFPYDCRTAACSHLERYDFTPEEVKILENQAKERMALLGSPYVLDDNNNIIVHIDPGSEGTMATDEIDLEDRSNDPYSYLDDGATHDEWLVDDD